MLKCINKFNIKELEKLGDKLLNNRKSEYKTFGIVVKFSGFLVKRLKELLKKENPGV
jgi:hypothetical protein